VINEKDCPRTLETSNGYLASQYGGTGATLDYVARPYIAVKLEYEDPAEGYDTVDREMTARAPHTGRAFVDDRCKVWDIMYNICGKVYIKPALRTRNGRDTYMLVFDHFLGPNNVGNMIDHCSISRIVAIRQMLLSTRLLFRSEMNEGSAFCVFLHSHARIVII
jgi:hypothetical protein